MTTKYFMGKVNFLKHYNFLKTIFLYFFIILIWVLYYFIDADYSFNYNENIFVLDWHKELQYLSLIKSSLSNLIIPFENNASLVVVELLVYREYFHVTRKQNKANFTVFGTCASFNEGNPYH